MLGWTRAQHHVRVLAGTASGGSHALMHATIRSQGQDSRFVLINY